MRFLPLAFAILTILTVSLAPAIGHRHRHEQQHHRSNDIRLVKKRIHDGLKFSRVIKYTNETIAEMRANYNSNKTQELSLDVLVVADFLTYQAFLEMSNGNALRAEHDLKEYLQAVFEQMKLIYDEIKFGNETLHMVFAGTWIATQERDCPLWLSWAEDEAERAINEQLRRLEEEEERRWNNATSVDDGNEDGVGNATDTDNNNATDVTTEGRKLRKFVDVTLEELQENNSTEMALKIDSKKAVDKFTIWLKEQTAALPRHEHAVLITKFDLISINGHSATQGMAYVGNICENGDSSSVVEDIGAGLTSLIMAHEIGHSLGALHDGAYEAAACDSNDNFLMAVAVSGSSARQSFLNSRRMSACSVESILENLKEPSASCVKKWRTTKSTNHTTVQKDFMKKPGETVSLTRQCQVAFGPTFIPCLQIGYFHGQSICERIWCSDGDSDECQTLNYFPAFDGTECGYNQWCVEGLCVPNTKKWMDCKDLNAKTCSRYSTSKLKHYCKSKDFREICCRTCAKKGKIY